MLWQAALEKEKRQKKKKKGIYTHDDPLLSKIQAWLQEREYLSYS